MDDVPGNRTNDRKLMMILAAAALFILIIAGINATNLAVARFSKRVREIGLRKVVGARRSQLAGQFLGESMAFSLVSAIAAAGGVVLLLPLFNGWIERSIQASRLASPAVLPAVATVVLIAVRRILGASVGRVVRMLTAEYVVLAVPACLLAWPASWLFMNHWLRSFAFRAPVQAWMFVLAGGAAAAVAFGAAAFKARSAAGRDAAASLRIE